MGVLNAAAKAARAAFNELQNSKPIRAPKPPGPEPEIDPDMEIEAEPELDFGTQPGVETGAAPPTGESDPSEEWSSLQTNLELFNLNLLMKTVGDSWCPIP